MQIGLPLDTNVDIAVVDLDENAVDLDLFFLFVVDSKALVPFIFVDFAVALVPFVFVDLAVALVPLVAVNIEECRVSNIFWFQESMCQ